VPAEQIRFTRDGKPMTDATSSVRFRAPRQYEAKNTPNSKKIGIGVRIFPGQCQLLFPDDVEEAK
jgi:hypothetical protein